MKPVVLGVALGLACGTASAQQVWRCEQDGQVRYTDQPCEKSGRPLPARDLKTNVADGVASEAARAAPPASAASAAASAPAAAASAASEAAADVPTPMAQEPPPVIEPRPARARRVYGVALMGLMNTDFVQRGYVPRRQNPAFTTSPTP